MKTPSNIFELNILNRIITISTKSKGDQIKTINKAYWEQLFTLTTMLLYLTPTHVTGTSWKSIFLSTYMSSRAAAVTLPYSEALDFLPGTSPESWLCHKRHSAWDIVRLLRQLKHANSEVQKPTDDCVFAAVNHPNGPLRKKNFTLTGSKGQGLWFVIGGYRSVLWVSVF